MAEAYRLLMQTQYGDACKVTVVPMEKMEGLSAYGAILIAKKLGLHE